MKTFKLLLFALFISMVSVAQTNLLSNGDFESVGYLTGSGTSFTLSGWNFSSGKDFFNETVNVISGSQTLRMGGGPTDGGIIFQLCKVTPGAIYRLGYTARTMDVTGTSGSSSSYSTGTLYGNIYQGNYKCTPTPTYLIKGSSVSKTITNSPQTVEFTVPTGCDTVRVNFYKDKYFVYLDDVSLYQLTASTIAISGANSYFYNGQPQGPATATATGSTGAITYSYLGVNGTTYAASSTPPTEAGNYTVTATVAGTSTYAAASATMAFTITHLTNGNYVANGDFEAASWTAGVPSSWLIPSYSTSTYYNPALSNVIGGTQSLFLGNPTSSCELYQVFSLEAGVTYRFGFTGRLLDATGPSGGTLSLVNTTQPTLWATIKEYTTAAKQLTSASVNSGTNASPVVEFTVGTNTMVKLDFYKNYKYVYIDDVFIQKKSTSALNSIPSNVQFRNIDKKNIEISGDDFSTVSVVSIVGKIVYKQAVNSTQFIINTDGFVPGVYCFVLTLKNGKTVSIKQTIG